MSRHYCEEWHLESWNRFCNEELPRVLSEICSLSGYSVLRSDDVAEIRIAVSGDNDEIETTYAGIPIPDEEGIFRIDDEQVVVVPEAETEELSDVKCCGELAMEYLRRRISPLREHLLPNEQALKTWLPLGEWILTFLRGNGQVLDIQNWVARRTHLRRIRIRNVRDMAPPIQVGRACPIETPEGPNIGKVLTVAVGAEIRNGSVVPAGDDPAESLGVSASMIPFIEYDDPPRLLMGANMMRQWIPPLQIQPALVQTGREPEEEDFWTGHDLLTAFISMGRGTFEDGIIMSESAVKKMRYEVPVEIGDKFSNRHGTKGVLSSILPDHMMPVLPDGSHVECVYSFIGLHTRMNTGQLFEAVYSTLVEKGQAPAEVPPFGAPSREEISRLLTSAGLPPNGMYTLSIPEGSDDRSTGSIGSAGTARSAESTEDSGANPRFNSLVGKVYWGRTRHIAAEKLRCGEYQQVQGMMEFWALRNAGAYGILTEYNGILSEENPEGTRLPKLIASGAEFESTFGTGEETGAFRKLRQALYFGGIETRFDGKAISFKFLEDEGDGRDGFFRLTEPVRHPWRSTRRLSVLPHNEDSEAFSEIEKENHRLAKLLRSDAPDLLLQSSRQSLQEKVDTYFNGLLSLMLLVPRGRVAFSARSIIVPGIDMTLDQVGLPEEMAWTLFGPFAARIVGEEAVRQRTTEAGDALDQEMSKRWVLINRAPTLSETSMIAFRPFRVGDRAIHLHPMVCRWISGDFDGDQAAVILPITEEGQRDCREKMSVTGHLRRNPDLIRTLTPTHEALWGLALCSTSPNERQRIEEITGPLPDLSDGMVGADMLGKWAFRFSTRGTEDSIAEDSTAVSTNTVKKVVPILEQLFDLGLREAAASGASFDPFMRVPAGSDPSHERSTRLKQEVMEGFASCGKYIEVPGGPQILACKAGARGNLGNLMLLTYSHYDAIKRPDGSEFMIERGKLDGLEGEQLLYLALQLRYAMADIVTSLGDSSRNYNRSMLPAAYTVLSRAAKACRTGDPGVVFASAAEREEVDPLIDTDSRLFMGLPVE